MQFFGGSEMISPSAPGGGSNMVGLGGTNKAHMMYIFNRNGVCLLYREWNRPLKTLTPHQDYKLMFGLLFSLKSFTSKMDPTSATDLPAKFLTPFHLHAQEESSFD
ncbi:hypothetical protein ACLOJK_010047 [Asimina triloba]